MTKENYVSNLTGISEKIVLKTLSLLNEGSTIPFIARYRKETTGGLDEVEIAGINDSGQQYEQIVKRQDTILKSIEEQGKLTGELREKISLCFDMNVLEDLYLPFKKKRETRADKARKKGLEGLAKIIMTQNDQNVYAAAERFVKGEVNSADEALEGARDIIA
ncbi:MAG: Tex-like N-terminal domain-containing protein, partial [Brumimicrobium sp.]|nr:Tex-like N-terminal domain-containing protein [Brumimicrobium sp.]